MIKKVKSFYHYLWAFFSSLAYLFPSKKIFVIGITGTKGKSTTASLLTSILEEAGYTVASLNSVFKKIGERTEKNTTGNTMPGKGYIQKFLTEAVKKSCHYAIVEVTSQGVVQNRHKFIDFDIAGITNIHPEHIESHGSFTAYKEAKGDFFRYVAKGKKLFFVNKEDPEKEFFIKCAGENEVVEFSYKDLDVKGLGEFVLSDFNREDAELARRIALTQGVSEKIIRKALKNFQGITGRMEWLKGRGYKVVVDYAHTPGSYEALYKHLKSLKPKRLVCVFGSYGEGRDKWKRGEIGELSDLYCDRIILTNEGPGDEEPMQIIKDIKKGVKKKECEIIIDRKLAIKTAITQAKKGDIIALIGKGHEDYIRIGSEKIPWNEVEIAKKAMKL